MKAYVILHIMILSCFFLGSVKGYAQNEYQKKDSVAKYYYYQNKAELAIVDSNYIESIGLFKKAFTFKSPNARELMNGLRLALILGDTAFASRCLNEFAINGLSQNVVMNFVGEELTQPDGLYRLLAKDYDSLLRVFNNSDKPNLAVWLTSIYERDQSIRQKNYTDKELKKVDESNIDSLILFTRKYGFPSFQLLGFADPRGGLGTGGTYGFILWHAANQEIGKLDSLGLSAVMKGIYPPDEFAQSFDNKVSPSRYHMLVPGIAEGVESSNAVLSDDTVDRFRAAIYLESMEDYKKKLNFMNSRKQNWYKFLLTPQQIFGMNFAK